MRASLSLLILCFVCLNSVFAADRYPFKTQAQVDQFAHLTEQLRCLVCQNESLADSNAGLAEDLRQQVYQQVQQGKTDAEIIHYLVARYGDFVRFDPPIEPRTYVLWYSPFVILILGLLILFCAIKRHRL